jgi:hypothetical protein
MLVAGGFDLLVLVRAIREESDVDIDTAVNLELPLRFKTIASHFLDAPLQVKRVFLLFTSLAFSTWN